MPRGRAGRRHNAPRRNDFRVRANVTSSGESRSAACRQGRSIGMGLTLVESAEGSGGEPSARFLHRRERGLGLRERSRATVDARGLGGDRDLLAGSRVSADAFLLCRLDPDGQLHDTPTRTFCALLSCSSKISSSTTRTRLASALGICVGSSSAVWWVLIGRSDRLAVGASCPWWDLVMGARFARVDGEHEEGTGEGD